MIHVSPVGWVEPFAKPITLRKLQMMGFASLYPSYDLARRRKGRCNGSMIHVSSLSALNNVAASLQRYDLLTLLSPDYPETDWRAFACERHLRLAFHDIVEPMPGLTAPDRDMMQSVLDFGRDAEDQRALLIHCWAGISRSSAAAFAIACDRNPGFERDIAIELRRRSPSATPNRLMVRLADDLLRRDGRMVEAINGIGRGAEAREGEPYALPLQWPSS
jgi:predicted protein tyrosine phosphatase